RIQRSRFLYLNCGGAVYHSLLSPAEERWVGMPRCGVRRSAPALPCALLFRQPSGYSERVKASPMEKTARKVVQRLRDRGHIAYFAGGCVRDLLRGLMPKDYDIATDVRPENVQALFPRTYAVGSHFGVIIVLEDDFQFEVATFRSDEAYIDGRHPSAVHFSSPEEDAKRRDFTINGMFFD